MKKGTVFVGMSGGVDSSVSAALLKEQGYDVVGVFMKVWSPDWMPCVWPAERRDAMRVAAHLNIPFLTFDFENEYKQGVIDYMIAEYKAGRTPNPDVMCNREVKFGAFLKRAVAMGADYVATGHYAQVLSVIPAQAGIQGLDSRLRGNDMRMQLLVATDTNKDQSYFLWTLGQEELKHALFPIGHLEKPVVRKLARTYGLPVAEKKDSQGLCFVGEWDLKDFLKRYIDIRPGSVLNKQGEVVGTHDGAVLYTIGERHGFTISKKTPDDLPYYVVGKNHERNEIVVAHETSADRAEAKEVGLSDVRWVMAKTPDLSKTYEARIRYRQPLQGCRLVSEGDRFRVVFNEHQRAVTPGQSLVLYDGDVMLGGGIIA